MCSKASQSLDTQYSKFIVVILFSLSIMNSQNPNTNQITATILLQQPIPTESGTTIPITRPTLDERIKQMTSIPKSISRTVTNQSADIIDLTTTRSETSIQSVSTTKISHEQSVAANLPSSSTLVSLPKIQSLPILIAPKKSAHSFLQRFLAQNIDHQ